MVVPPIVSDSIFTNLHFSSARLTRALSDFEMLIAATQQKMFTDGEFLTFVSLLLAVSMAYLLQFIGRTVANWHRVRNPWPTLFWTGTAAMCHADYWYRMSRFTNSDISKLYFYLELAFPTILVVSASILAAADLDDEPGDDDFVDLHEHYKRIAPYFSRC